MVISSFQNFNLQIFFGLDIVGENSPYYGYALTFALAYEEWNDLNVNLIVNHSLEFLKNRLIYF